MKLNVDINRQRVRKDGKCVVRLTVYLHGRGRYSFPIAIEPARWDKKLRRVKPGPQAFEFNQAIARGVSRAEVLALEPGMTAAKLCARLEVPGDGSLPLLVDAIRTAAATHTQKFTEATRVAFGTLMPDLVACFPDVVLGQLSSQHVQQLDRHLRSRDLHINTVRGRLKLLRIGYNVALKDHGLPKSQAFEGNMPKEKPTRKRFLTQEQLDTLCAFDLDIPEIRLAKHTMLLQTFLGGMRISDVILLRPDAFRHVSGRWEMDYDMKKTGAQQWVPIPPQAVEIIEHYRGGDHVLPLYTGGSRNQIGGATARVNRSLKVIAQLTGLPKDLSTHYARHTFGDWARREEVSLKTLQMIFRHASINTTMVYMASFANKEVQEAFTKLSKSMPKSVV